MPLTSSAADRPTVPVEVRRSSRRHRTVTAYHRDGRLVVLVPEWFSADEERRWVERMRARLDHGTHRSPATDHELEARAAELSQRYLRARAQPRSVRWVRNQGRRWGSATPSAGTIRLSHRLQVMPDWVIDYVLLHELAHLIEPGHGPQFWALLDGYPERERARGYLEGYSAARQADDPVATTPE